MLRGNVDRTNTRPILPHICVNDEVFSLGSLGESGLNGSDLNPEIVAKTVNNFFFIQVLITQYYEIELSKQIILARVFCCMI